ncbi:hypothetical protein HDV05_006262 [Chytridiales sp. JEL 0842]|nr:hypothetical protein HDV05_006262 [Chytridiales sp. JEL 0842]
MFPHTIKVGNWDAPSVPIDDPEDFFTSLDVIDEDDKLEIFEDAAVSAEQLEALNVRHKVLIDFWKTHGAHFKQTWLAFSDADRRKVVAPLLPAKLQSPKYRGPPHDKFHNQRKEAALKYLPDLMLEGIIERSDTQFKYTGDDFMIDRSLLTIFEILCKPEISDIAIACIIDAHGLLTEDPALCSGVAEATAKYYYVSLIETEREPLTFGTYFEVLSPSDNEGRLFHKNCICSPEEFYLLTKRLMNLFDLFLRCADMYRALILHTTRRTKMISLALIGCFKCSVKAGQAVLKACSRCRRVYYCSTECQKKDWAEHQKKRCTPHQNRPPLTLNDAERFAMALYKLA